MAAPTATSVTDDYPGQSASALASSEWVYQFDAGSDTAYLPRASKAFDVTADCTVAVKTTAGQAVTLVVKAGVLYPVRCIQLLSTGSVLGSAVVRFYC